MTSKRSNTASAKMGRDIAPGVPAQKGSVMEEEVGRVASDRALVSDQAASRLAPSGFDPSRDLEDAYQVVGEMLQYFDNHKLATWAPIAAIIQQQRMLGRKETLRVLVNIVDALDLAANRLSLHAVNAIASGDKRAGEYSSWADEPRSLLRTLPANFRDRDRSGEADETQRGSAEGKSPGRNGIAQGEQA